MVRGLTEFGGFRVNSRETLGHDGILIVHTGSSEEHVRAAVKRTVIATSKGVIT
jgi:hypothetical protein